MRASACVCAASDHAEACPRCRDTGIVHWLRNQGAPWAQYVPCQGNPPCDCAAGVARQAAR